MNESFWSKRPALRFVVLFAGGIVLADSFSLSTAISYLILAAFFILFLTFQVLKAGLSADLAAIACIVSLGIALHTHNLQNSHARLVQPVGLEEPIIVAGYVDVDPVLQGNGYRLGVKSVTFVRESGVYRLERRFFVTAEKSKIAPLADSLELGTFVGFSATLHKFPSPRNPGEFDYGRYLQLNEIQGVVSVGRTDEFRIFDSGQTSFRRIVGRVQKSLFKVIDQFHKPERAGFIKGVALGHREDIALEVKQSFIDTGTIHILAVSGSNVAVIALMFYSFFGILRISKRSVTVLTIIGLLFYMVITGMSPSVIRATIMAIVILVGMAIERKADIYNSLGVAAAILLLWDTNFLFDVGFQLSFAAVVSLVYFYPFLAAIIKRIPDRFEEVKAIDYVLKLFAVSLAAQIGTLPFTAFYFGKISVVSLLANLVVVPVSGLNTMIAFVTIVSSFLSDFIAKTYAVLNDFLVVFLLGFVKFASRVPYAYVETAGLTNDSTFVYYAALLFLFNFRKKELAKGLLIFLLLASNAAIFHRVFAFRPPKLIITMLDVGQGDAIVVKFPNGRTLLLDDGPMSAHSDAGERVIGPFLKREGIRTVDALLISHPHADHAGGTSFLLNHFNVSTMMESVSSSDSFYVSMLFLARRMNVPIMKTKLGDEISIDSSARMYVLHPHVAIDSSSNQNNSSNVVKLIYGATSILLCGDAEAPAETKILDRYGNFITADIIKAGHHGSSTSSTEPFVDVVQPRVALVSVGINNKFHHPSSEVILRYKSRVSQLHRTDEDGAIVIESDGIEWRTLNWRK